MDHYTAPDKPITPRELPIYAQIELFELLASSGVSDKPRPWAYWATELCLQFMFIHGVDVHKIVQAAHDRLHQYRSEGR